MEYPNTQLTTLIAAVGWKLEQTTADEFCEPCSTKNTKNLILKEGSI